MCSIYKSPKREEMYLYVECKSELEKLPQSLLSVFGEPRFVMTLTLSSDLKLARVDRTLVEHSIREQGYYLQMPPSIVDIQKNVSIQ